MGKHVGDFPKYGQVLEDEDAGGEQKIYGKQTVAAEPPQKEELAGNKNDGKASEAYMEAWSDNGSIAAPVTQEVPEPKTEEITVTDQEAMASKAVAHEQAGANEPQINDSVEQEAPQEIPLAAQEVPKPQCYPGQEPQEAQASAAAPPPPPPPRQPRVAYIYASQDDVAKYLDEKDDEACNRFWWYLFWILSIMLLASLMVWCLFPDQPRPVSRQRIIVTVPDERAFVRVYQPSNPYEATRVVYSPVAPPVNHSRVVAKDEKTRISNDAKKAEERRLKVKIHNLKRERSMVAKELKRDKETLTKQQKKQEEKVTKTEED